MSNFHSEADQSTYYLVRGLTKLTDEEIKQISDSNGGITNAYIEGKFCQHCKRFGHCGNLPARKAKGLDNKQMPHMMSEVLESFAKILLLSTILDVLRPSDDDDSAENPREIDIEKIFGNKPE